MSKFNIPDQVYFGNGSLIELKNLKGNRAVICTGGSSMKRSGFLDKAADYLKEAGMDVRIFDGIEPDPSIETVNRGKEFFLEFRPDWIVGMGGGSSIDAAKAMWCLYEYPEKTIEELTSELNCVPPLRNKAKFCAVPSTSGTGSEVTDYSIISSYDGQRKLVLASPEIYPDVSIVDADLCETMPQKLIAHTGMDALTHALEAYVATGHNDYSDAYAIHAIDLIRKNIKASYDGNLDARRIMHNAQNLAGTAFSNAGLGLAHSLAHVVGVRFIDRGAHLIHGATNAMCLAKVVEINSRDPEARSRYAQIADELQLGGFDEREKVWKLIDMIKGLNRELNIPGGMKYYGLDALPCEEGFISDEIFEQRIDEITEKTMNEPTTVVNPYKPNFDEMKDFIKASYYDYDIQF